MNKSIQWSVAIALLSSPLLTLAAETAANDEIVEVVITAQKRTEKLSDVPVSAAVVSSDVVASANAGDISDLNRLVPSVNLNGTINGRVPYGMRGISSVSNEGTVGISSGVAIMLDGVPVPSDSRAANALEDVQSVEVLKGPQATLGGRTAASGVINIVTRKPSASFGGDVSATMTSDNEYRLNAFVSGPISDAVNYSLAGYYTSRDFPIKNLHLNKTTNEQIYGLRGKLLLQPSDKLDISVAARVGKDNSDGFNFVYTHTSPGIHLLTGQFGPPFLAQDVLLPGITPNFDNQVYSSPISVFSDVEDTDVSVDLQYQLANGMIFGSTTAFQHEKQVNMQDLFAVDIFFWNVLTGGNAPPFGNNQLLREDIKQSSQEFKLVSAPNAKLGFVAGLFYSDTKVDLLAERNLLPAFDNFDVLSETKTTDVYGRVTWNLATQTSLVTGLRYNHDEISDRKNQFLYTAVGPTPVNPPVIFNDLTFNGSYSESTMVGDFSLQQKLSSGNMLYATYARGYAPAAFNTNNKLTLATDSAVTGATTSTFENLADPVAKKMNIDHIELGSKGTYLDKHLTINAALFDTKYKDFQVQIFDVNNTSINPPLILANAGEAETRGLEVDLNYSGTDWRMNLNAAYIDAKFNDYQGAPCYYPDVPGSSVAGCTGTPSVQDLSGKPMPNSPKYKWVFGAERTLHVGGNGTDLVLAGNYSWRDKAQMLADQNPYAVQPSFGILNLSAALNRGKQSITLFVNNATDEHYFTDLEDFWSAPWGATNTVVGQPARDTNRYYGLRWSTKF